MFVNMNKNAFEMWTVLVYLPVEKPRGNYELWTEGTIQHWASIVSKLINISTWRIFYVLKLHNVNLEVTKLLSNT